MNTDPQTNLAAPSTGPDWTHARELLAATKHGFRLALASQILLGQELLATKIELGFAGRGGDRPGSGRPSLAGEKSKAHGEALITLNRTWDQWTKAELGIADSTANRLIETYQAAKDRLKRLGGHARALQLLDTPPAALDEEGRNTLAALVDKLEWGESQKQLLEEFRIAKRHVPLAGGDTSDHRKPALPEPRQMAFAFFGGVPEVLGKLRKGLTSLVLSPDYQAYLHELPLIGQADEGLGLEDLKATLEDVLHGEVARLLADVKQAIADRHQSLSYANPNR